MANIQKCVLATEASNDSLKAIVDKALGYPRKGTHVGNVRVAMPDTWDGNGPCPPGWTKQATANYVNTALDAALPIDDALATELQKPGALALLSAAEQTTLSVALAARASKDLESAAYIPKVSAVTAGAAVAVEETSLDTKGSP